MHQDKVCLFNVSKHRTRSRHIYFYCYFLHSCEFNCDNDTETVCGSDSNTYVSACELRKKNCLDITNIYIKHYNRCTSRRAVNFNVCKLKL